jgi:hypothetical protein
MKIMPVIRYWLLFVSLVPFIVVARLLGTKVIINNNESTVAALETKAESAGGSSDD